MQDGGAAGGGTDIEHGRPGVPPDPPGGPRTAFRLGGGQSAELVARLGAEGQPEPVRGLGAPGQRPADELLPAPGLTGRRPSSIRYCEQIGLLPPARRVSGRRVYGPDTVRTLAVIETGQRAGLSLGEIGDLLSASPGDQDAIERLRELAARKLPEITALIARTEIVRSWLESAARCECPSLDECPLFDEPDLPEQNPGTRPR